MADGNGALLQDPVARLLEGGPVWTGESDDILVCRAVRDETHDGQDVPARAPPAASLRLSARPVPDLRVRHRTARRSIAATRSASAPTRPNLVSITVKRVPGGPVSNWLHDHLRPGATVKAIGPMGDFSCLNHPAEKYLLLSGGSGITPLMSMARTFHDLAESRDIVFVHAARSPADIIFRSELETMARQSKKLPLRRHLRGRQRQRSLGRLSRPADVTNAAPHG